ncbi:hypothetical protein ABE427_02375 [Acinetobacter higginsii]|uniref:hypothetical protein n=1 Tax=Acinetobacter higginsii TaxID=70347 RepID=UPI00320A7612
METEKNKSKDRFGVDERVYNDLLYVHLSWCVWHEGVRLYDKEYPGVLISVESMRKQAVPLQGHDEHGAQAIIIRATDEELLGAMQLMESRVEAEHHLSSHISWVADHEHQRSNFYSLLAAKGFLDIRDLYYKYQKHNNDAKNLLCCVSNIYLENLIKSI